MLKTILVAVDSSPQHAAILDQAAELAIASGAEVHVASVADPTKGGLAPQRSCSDVVGSLGREVDQVLHAACERLSARGVACSTHALSGLVSEQIILLAGEIQASMIIMGHRHLNWVQRILDNSVGSDLLEHSPCSVLIVKEG